MAKRKTRRRKTADIQDASLSNPLARWVKDAFGVGESESVTPRDMLSYPPAWHCINKICGHVGQLPLNLYERDQRDERRKKLAEQVPAYWVVKHQPNPIMSPLTVRQALQSHALWSGNGRAYIKRNARGEPMELWPLPPSRCASLLVTTDGNEAGAEQVVGGQVVSKWHILRTDSGEKVPIPDRDVLHIAGLGYDGVQGYSVIDLAKQWLGLAKSQNKAINGNFRSGARPSFMLKAPPGVFKNEADAKKWLADFDERHAGVENEGRVGLLTGGMEAQVLQISARDSQWQEQRIFSRQDAAIWFQVEQMLGDDSSVSYRSLEEKNRAYVQNCLMTWLTKWEQECWMKLLTTQQRESMRFYFRFVTAALLRGSLAERYQAYMIGRQGEWLSVNDIRESEDMNAIDGGDEYINPVVNTRDAATPKSQGGASQATARLKALIASRLGEIQSVEAQRVKSAAESSTNFREWVDNFYQPTQFAARIESTFTIVGLSAATAQEYASESRQQLVEAAGRCTQEILPVEVSRLVAEWPQRVEQLAAVAAGA